VLESDIPVICQIFRVICTSIFKRDILLISLALWL